MDRRKQKRLLPRIFLSYIKDHILGLVIFLLLCSILTITFFLYNYTVEAVLYGALVSLIPVCVVAGIDFYRYYRQYADLLSHKDAIINGIEAPAVSGSAMEKELGEIIHAMAKNMRRQNSQHHMQKSETIDYYTLWVHQIKTPISAMRLILQSGPGRKNHALQQELFKIEQYVDMVLGYLRLDEMSSDLKLQPYPVYSIVRQAVKKFTPTFIYARLSLDLQQFENRVITDEKWLLFVIEQILSNALKYTQKGGIRIYMDDMDTLYIEDTGIGIAKEDLPRIFEKGFTGNNGRIDKNATGLGLYLCRRITDKLQNRIEIQSDVGHGTIVRLHLHRTVLPTE